MFQSLNPNIIEDKFYIKSGNIVSASKDSIKKRYEKDEDKKNFDDDKDYESSDIFVYLKPIKEEEGEYKG
jgi:hypothetical protein